MKVIYVLLCCLLLEGKDGSCMTFRADSIKFIRSPCEEILEVRDRMPRTPFCVQFVPNTGRPVYDQRRRRPFDQTSRRVFLFVVVFMARASKQAKGRLSKLSETHIVEDRGV